VHQPDQIQKDSQANNKSSTIFKKITEASVLEIKPGKRYRLIRPIALYNASQTV